MCDHEAGLRRVRIYSWTCMLRAVPGDRTLHEMAQNQAAEYMLGHGYQVWPTSSSFRHLQCHHDIVMLPLTYPFLVRHLSKNCWRLTHRFIPGVHL